MTFNRLIEILQYALSIAIGHPNRSKILQVSSIHQITNNFTKKEKKLNLKLLTNATNLQNKYYKSGETKFQ